MPLTHKQIGFITFISDNYGTCLQAFAMKKAIQLAIKGRGDIHFIHCLRPVKKQNNRKSCILAKILFHYSITELYRWNRFKTINDKRIKLFQEFKQMIYGQNSKYDSYEKLKELDGDFTHVVCGSDMIWSPEFAESLDVYLLTWSTKAKNIAYAPSIGNVEMEGSLKVKYREAFKKFSALSCRELSGASFISSLSGLKIPVVVDPTLLFTASEWLNWFPNEKLTSSPYILVYCFGGISSIMRRHINDLAKQKSMIVRYILSPNINDTVRECRYGSGVYGPKEYVGLFSDASFTIVNGYHGLLFSLIFEKPFVCLHRGSDEHWSVHENRMKELIDRLGLEKRYILPDDKIEETMLHLDYSEISRKIKSEREVSWNYLKKALE